MPARPRSLPSPCRCRFSGALALTLALGSACQSGGSAATAPPANASAPAAPALSADGAKLARQMRTLDGLQQRGERAARDQWLASNAAVATLPAHRFLRAYAQDDRRLAWKDLEALRREHPKSALGYLGILSIYVEWKVVEEAQKAYEQAVTLDPGLAVAHARMGSVLLAKGQNARALPLFDKALALDGEDADALLGKARILKAEGKLPQALDFYRRATVAWPESLVTAEEYAEAVEATGQKKAAANAFLVAAKIDPHPYAKLVRAGALLAQDGDRAGAEGVYKTALEHNPADAPLLMTLGKLAGERGDTEGQLAYFARAVEGQPDNLELHRALAASYLKKGENAGAERHLLEVIRLQPEDAVTHLALARLYAGATKYREALEHFEAAARTGTDEAAGAERDALRSKLLLKAEPATGKDVNKVFDAALKGIIAAYEARIREVPDLAGGVTVVVDVAEDGSVKEVSLKQDSLKDEILVANVYFTFKSARFPAGKKARYEYPIAFSGMGPASGSKPAPAKPAAPAKAPTPPPAPKKPISDPSALGGK